MSISQVDEIGDRILGLPTPCNVSHYRSTEHTVQAVVLMRHGLACMEEGCGCNKIPSV